MTECCFSSCPKNKFSGGLIISDFVLFCSYILSQPLYFSYLIFFSPYLLKLLSFLSPLFITTTLLLLAALLTTLVPSGDSKEGYLLNAYNAILEKVSWKAQDEEDEDDDGLEQFEELEVYKIVFGASTIEVSDQNPQNLKENPVRINQDTEEGGGMGDYSVESHRKIDEGKRVEKESMATECEMLTSDAKSMEDVIMSSKSDKVVEQVEESTVRRGSEAPRNAINYPHSGENYCFSCGDKCGSAPHPAVGSIKGKEPTLKVSENLQREGENRACNNNDHREEALRSRSCSQRLSEVSWDDGNVCEENSQTFSGHIRSFGSMRKEKEWRRTLACKLFEERHNVDSDSAEGMDLLWEVYEKESSGVKTKNREKMKKKKQGKVVKVDDNGRTEEEGDEEVDDGQLCCLQALKFSAGKMNLGMPKLVKISKVFKGVGWLQHLSKNGRKVHHHVH